MTRLRAIVMKPVDNVCTVLENVEPGAEVDLDATGEKLAVRVAERIPFGHKFAIRNIQHGEPILKYGEVIGVATREIRPGEHVHVHNLESRRGRGDKQSRS
jgi:altronate dehydratase small subunit